MRRPKMILLGATLAAFAVTAVAAPASAASSTKLALVNGFPGKKVDVCVNGREVKSGLPYGKKVIRRTKTAKAKVKFFSRHPGRCTGVLLGKRLVDFDDATVVITKKAPKKVVVFDNSRPGPKAKVAEDTGFHGYRFGHASDLQPVNVHLGFTLTNPPQTGPLGPAPTALESFDKGDSSPSTIVIWAGDGAIPVIAVDIRSADDVTRLIRPLAFQPLDGKTYEILLVGSRAANARFVVVTRALDF